MKKLLLRTAFLVLTLFALPFAGNSQAPPPVRDTVLIVNMCGGIDSTWTCPYFEEGVQYRWEPMILPLQNYVGHEVTVSAENLTTEYIAYEYYMSRTYTDDLGNYIGAFTDTIEFRIYPEADVFIPITSFSSCPGDTSLMYYDPLSSGAYLLMNPSNTTSIDSSNSPYVNLFPSEQTFYEMFYTNPGGCLRGPFTIQVNVGAPPPLLEIDLPPIICLESDGVKLKNYVNPTSGLFSGMGVVGDTAFIPSIAGVGVHSITYTMLYLACNFSIVDTIIVTVPDEITFDPLPNFCLNDNRYELEEGIPAGGVYSGEGVSNNFFTPLNAGTGSHVITYSIELDEFCTSQTSQIVTVISIPPKPSISISPTGVTELCDGQTLTLTSSQAGSYYWPATFETTQNITVSQSGNYYVQVTNAAGCANRSDTLDILAGENPAIVELSSPLYPNGFNTSSYSLNDGSINLEVEGGTLPYIYSWSNGANSEDLEQLQIGEYSIIITDSVGCSTSGSIELFGPDTVIFPGEGSPFGLPNAFTPNGDGYNDLYVISGLDGSLLDNTFRVWDISRQLVFEAVNYDNTWDGRNMKGDKLPPDTYFGVFDSKTLGKIERTYINIRYE